MLVGQRGAVGNGFVFARGVDLAQVHLGHAIPEVRRWPTKIDAISFDRTMVVRGMMVARK